MVTALRRTRRSSSYAAGTEFSAIGGAAWVRSDEDNADSLLQSAAKDYLDAGSPYGFVIQSLRTSDDEIDDLHVELSTIIESDSIAAIPLLLAARPQSKPNPFSVQ
jgi:hypothetical protein